MVKKLLLTLLLSSSLFLSACAPFSVSPISSSSGDEPVRTGLPATVAPLPEVNSSSEQIEVLAKLPSQNTQVFVDSVTDSRGTYARYVPVYDFPSGISGEKKDAAQFALNFVFLEAIDSIAFDDPAGWDQWVSNVAQQYISASAINDVIAGDSAGPSQIIIRSDTLGGQNPFTIRDGGERVGNKTITSLSARKSGDTYIVDIKGSAIAYSDDQAMKDWWAQGLGKHN